MKMDYLVKNLLQAQFFYYLPGNHLPTKTHKECETAYILFKQYNVEQVNVWF